MWRAFLLIGTFDVHVALAVKPKASNSVETGQGSRHGEDTIKGNLVVLEEQYRTFDELATLIKGSWTGLVDAFFDADEHSAKFETRSKGNFLRSRSNETKTFLTKGRMVPDSANQSSTLKTFNGTVYIQSSPNATGERRSTDFHASNCVQNGLKCVRINPTKKFGKLAQVVQHLQQGLKIWSENAEDFAIFAEDDTRFIGNFPRELQKSTSELPASWQVFHLCPGFLHGRGLKSQAGYDSLGQSRKFSAKDPFSMLAEARLEGNPRKTSSGRAFLDWPRAGANETCCASENERGAVPGGPLALVAKRSSIPLLQTTLENAYHGEGTPPVDVIFRDAGVAHSTEHFVAAHPQLCVESKQLGLAN